MSKPKIPANPFGALLGLAPVVPRSFGKATLVVEGQRVASPSRLPVPDAGRQNEDTEDEAVTPWLLSQQLRHRKELARIAKRNWYERKRQDPAFLAQRAEYRKAHRDQARADLQRYLSDPANRERVREQRRQCERRSYHADPEAGRARSREYYERNRESILAKLKAKRDQARAQRQAQPADSSPTTNEGPSQS